MNGYQSQTRKNMNTDLLMQIENLRRASLKVLRDKYREVFEEEPQSRHREHLFRRLAWQMQALAEGDLSQRARDRAQQIARDADLRMIAPPEFLNTNGRRLHTAASDANRRADNYRLPRPGTILTRDWNGRTLLVEVLAKGFRFENKEYSSLSAIATAVTGTRWNGFAFFGLKKRVKNERKRTKRRAA